jgi:hypothetical protein
LHSTEELANGLVESSGAFTLAGHSTGRRAGLVPLAHLAREVGDLAEDKGDAISRSQQPGQIARTSRNGSSKFSVLRESDQ